MILTIQNQLFFFHQRWRFVLQTLNDVSFFLLFYHQQNKYKQTKKQKHEQNYIQANKNKKI